MRSPDAGSRTTWEDPARIPRAPGSFGAAGGGFGECVPTGPEGPGAATAGSLLTREMRVVFAGTPGFASTVLLALLGSRHEVVAVYTRPDRRAGRGRALRTSPVKRVAEAHGIRVRQPPVLRTKEVRARLREDAPDVIAVAAYGLVFPAEILRLPAGGCINVHASLLPRWRGAAPVQRAILAGDERTGVSIMLMDTGLDTGEVLASSATPIHPRDTAGDLLERLAVLGADLLVHTLDHLGEARSKARPQKASGALRAARIEKHEARLDWRCGAVALDRLVRAMNPEPGAFTTSPGPRTGGEQRRLKIWRARALAGSDAEPPGRVMVANGKEVQVATGRGRLALLEVQREGGRRMPIGAYVNAHPLAPGAVLGP